MKKTLRLIITEKCNFNCGYCCNKLPEVRERFQYKTFEEIEELIVQRHYEAVCITGGEPLIRFWDTYMILLLCRRMDISCYLYTNGIMMDNDMMYVLEGFAGINIGLHCAGQLESILEKTYLKKLGNVRFYVWECIANNKDIVGDLPKELIKTWKKDECFNNADNEDWVVLHSIKNNQN